MAESQNSTENLSEIVKTIKKTVEEDSKEEIVKNMIANKERINWGPLAILVVCKQICERLYPAGLVLNSGTKINVTEQNCWRKIEQICFSLRQRGFFRDQSGYTLRKKLPVIQLLWAGDGQEFIIGGDAAFKNLEDADRFINSCEEYWRIISQGKNIAGIKISYVQTFIPKNVQIG